MVWKEKVIRGYNWSFCSMLKCIPKAGIDKLFQLILNPGTAQRRLKTEEQHANRKKIQLLKSNSLPPLSEQRMASRRSSEKSSKRNFSFARFHLLFWNNATGTGRDRTTPRVQVPFHPINRTRCQGCNGHSCQWLSYVQHEEGLRLVSPDIFTLLWREGGDEDNIILRTWLQTSCPHKSVSLYTPFIDNGKKVSPFDSKNYHSKPNPARQSRSSGRY